MNWLTKRTYSTPSVWTTAPMVRSPLNDLFEDFFGELGTTRRAVIQTPRIEVSENDKAVILEAELPGLEEKDIKLTLENDVLTLEGSNTREKEDQKLHLSERSYGAFRRSLRLGDYIDSEQISARFKNGLLTVTLPKAEPGKSEARSIKIKSA